MIIAMIAIGKSELRHSQKNSDVTNDQLLA
jgi:hypothetical protein